MADPIAHCKEVYNRAGEIEQNTRKRYTRTFQILTPKAASTGTPPTAANAPDSAPADAGAFVLAHLKWLRKLASPIGTALGIEAEDCVHELIVWVLRAYRRYDPARSKGTTFCALQARNFFSFTATKCNAKKRTALKRIDISRVGADGNEGLGVLAADPLAIDPADAAADGELLGALAEALELLPDRDRELLGEFFGAFGACKVKTSAVVARTGLSRQRVHQLRDRALAKLAGDDALRDAAGEWGGP